MKTAALVLLAALGIVLILALIGAGVLVRALVGPAET